MKVDHTTLVDCIERCFTLAGSDQFDLAQRKELAAQGKRLRGCLINLLTAEFPDDLNDVRQANTQLRQVNQNLQQAIDDLNDFQERVAELNQLVGALDNLLGLASSFH